MLQASPLRGIALTLSAVVLTAGCSTVTNSFTSDPEDTHVSSGCGELLAVAREYIETGQTSSQKLDWTLNELKDRCGSEYAKLAHKISDIPARDTVELSEQVNAFRPSGSISWSEAIANIGGRHYVCGPLVNAGASGDDVFLNLGRGYPDVERFTIVLWDVGGIEVLPEGTMLCATGTITLYEGTAQIELRSIDGVEVWE